LKVAIDQLGGHTVRHFTSGGLTAHLDDGFAPRKVLFVETLRIG